MGNTTTQYNIHNSTVNLSIAGNGCIAMGGSTAENNKNKSFKLPPDTNKNSHGTTPETTEDRQTIFKPCTVDNTDCDEVRQVQLLHTEATVQSSPNTEQFSLTNLKEVAVSSYKFLELSAEALIKSDNYTANTDVKTQYCNLDKNTACVENTVSTVSMGYVSECTSILSENQSDCTFAKVFNEEQNVQKTSVTPQRAHNTTREADNPEPNIRRETSKHIRIAALRFIKAEHQTESKHRDSTTDCRSLDTQIDTYQSDQDTSILHDNKQKLKSPANEEHLHVLEELNDKSHSFTSSSTFTKTTDSNTDHYQDCEQEKQELQDRRLNNKTLRYNTHTTYVRSELSVTSNLSSCTSNSNDQVSVSVQVMTNANATVTNENFEGQVDFISNKDTLKASEAISFAFAKNNKERRTKNQRHRRHRARHELSTRTVQTKRKDSKLYSGVDLKCRVGKHKKHRKTHVSHNHNISRTKFSGRSLFRGNEENKTVSLLYNVVRDHRKHSQRDSEKHSKRVDTNEYFCRRCMKHQTDDHLYDVCRCTNEVGLTINQKINTPNTPSCCQRLTLRESPNSSENHEVTHTHANKPAVWKINSAENWNQTMINVSELGFNDHGRYCLENSVRFKKWQESGKTPEYKSVACDPKFEGEDHNFDTLNTSSKQIAWKKTVSRQSAYSISSTHSDANSNQVLNEMCQVQRTCSCSEALETGVCLTLEDTTNKSEVSQWHYKHKDEIAFSSEAVGTIERRILSATTLNGVMVTRQTNQNLTGDTSTQRLDECPVLDIDSLISEIKSI